MEERKIQVAATYNDTEVKFMWIPFHIFIFVVLAVFVASIQKWLKNNEGFTYLFGLGVLVPLFWWLIAIKDVAWVNGASPLDMEYMYPWYLYTFVVLMARFFISAPVDPEVEIQHQRKIADRERDLIHDLYRGDIERSDDLPSRTLEEKVAVAQELKEKIYKDLDLTITAEDKLQLVGVVDDIVHKWIADEERYKAWKTDPDHPDEDVVEA